MSPVSFLRQQEVPQFNLAVELLADLPKSGFLVYLKQTESCRLEDVSAVTHGRPGTNNIPC